MKKIVSLILCFSLLLPTVAVFAQEFPQTEKEYFDDGSYITVFISDEENEAADFFMKIMEFFRKLIEFFTGRKTVSGTKYVDYYSSENELLWSVKLKADFIYSKKETLCTDSVLTVEIYDNDWQLIYSSNSEILNSAEADFMIRQYKLGVPLKTIERKLTITCDTDGIIR